MSRMTTSGLRLSARASPSLADSAVSTSTEARAKARRKAWRMEGSSSTMRRVAKEALPQLEGIANCKLQIEDRTIRVAGSYMTVRGFSVAVAASFQLAGFAGKLETCRHDAAESRTLHRSICNLQFLIAARDLFLAARLIRQ